MKANSYFDWLASKIARTMLYIKATCFDMEKTYTWACGLVMHIYNDNRMMLGSFPHRLRVAQGFIKMIKNKGINPDYIIGTSTSGIAPAATVAQYMNKRLLVRSGEKYILYKPNLLNKPDIKRLAAPRNKEYMPSIVISDSPLSIPFGIQYANYLKIPFAYLREQKKDHGKMQRAEGIIKPRGKALLISSSESSLEHFVEFMEKEYKVRTIMVIQIESDRNYFFYDRISKPGNAVVIEDLVSTGGSSAYEVFKARNSGLQCDYCLSIFNYGFESSRKQFSGEEEIDNKYVRLDTPCKNLSLLTFRQLMSEIKRKKFFSKQITEKMWEENKGFDERYKEMVHLRKQSQTC